jgi:hypothetical protein
MRPNIGLVPAISPPPIDPKERIKKFLKHAFTTSKIFLAFLFKKIEKKVDFIRKSSYWGSYAKGWV